MNSKDLLKQYEESLESLIPESVKKHVLDFIKESVYKGYDSCTISELDISYFSKLHDKDCAIGERLELNDIWGLNYIPVESIFTKKVKAIEEKEVQLASRREKRWIIIRNLSNLLENLGYKTEINFLKVDNEGLYGDQSEIAKLSIYWRNKDE